MRESPTSWDEGDRTKLYSVSVNVLDFSYKHLSFSTLSENPLPISRAALQWETRGERQNAEMQCVTTQDVPSVMGTQRSDELSLPEGAAPGFG